MCLRNNWTLELTLFFFFQVSPNGAVLTYSDPTLVFVFLLVFTVATINFSFMISAFFSRGECVSSVSVQSFLDDNYVSFLLSVYCFVLCAWWNACYTVLILMKCTVCGLSYVGQSCLLFSLPLANLKHKSSNKKLWSNKKLETTQRWLAKIIYCICLHAIITLLIS